MHIDKYKVEDYYELPDGVSFETIEDVLCYQVGYCGCGDPEAGLKYLGRVLALIDAMMGDLNMEERKLKVRELFPHEGQEWHTYYMLDDKELTEHGGSVPGWLTDKGREIMEDIQELYTTAEK